MNPNQEEVDVYREIFGTRFVVQCEEFKTRLQTNVDEKGQGDIIDNVSKMSMLFSKHNCISIKMNNCSTVFYL